MIIHKYTTTVFREQLKKVQKTKKAGYSECFNDILNFINEKDIDALWDARNTEYIINSDLRIKKLRINNSLNKQGNSSGYRLISVLNKDKNSITFNLNNS